jgi:hypothetical protein
VIRVPAQEGAQAMTQHRAEPCARSRACARAPLSGGAARPSPRRAHLDVRIRAAENLLAAAPPPGVYGPIASPSLPACPACGSAVPSGCCDE